MPVTAKFSQDFYDRLGHAVADELVEWFNQVDATYRTEFRDLFASNAQAQDVRIQQFRAETDGRLAQMNARLAQMDARIERFAAEIRLEIAGLRKDMVAFEARMIRWMFLMWVGTLGTVIAILALR